MGNGLSREIGPNGLRRGLIQCAVGGMMMAIAMPPYGLWPLAWVAIVPLWRWAIASPCSGSGAEQAGLNWQRRSACAAAWAALYAGITLHWLWDLHPLTWMGIPWGPSLAIALLAWLAVVLWRTLSIVLWTQLTAWLARGHSVGLRISIGVALWCAVDWLWSCGPLYWDSFGLSQSPHNLAILQLGRWGGPAAVNAAIVAVNGLLAEAWRLQTDADRQPSHRRKIQRQQGWTAVGMAIALHAVGALLYFQAQAGVAADTAQQTPVQIGIVQGNIPTREKLSAAGVKLGVERYAAGFQTLAERGAGAVLMPEGALPFVWSRGQQTWGKPLLQAIAAHSQTELWLGTFELAENSPEQIDSLIQSNSLTQSLLRLDAAGKLLSRYNKVKLVPLGEYIPGGARLQSALEAIGIGRLSSLPVGMVPGARSQQFESRLGPVAVQICYEPAFSSIMRQQVAAGAQWLITSSNLDPYGRQLMAQAEALDVMRAIESDRWVVRATNTGFSGIVAPTGRVQWRSTAGEFVTHLAQVYSRDTQTPYVRWGNWLPIFLIGSMAAVLIIQRSSRYG